MKNLKLLYKLQEEFSENNVTHLLRHPTDNISFIYNGNKLQKVDHNKNEIQHLGEFENIVEIEFVELNNDLCLAAASGDIIHYYLDSNDHEVVGMLGDGISAMSFSPDQELVVFVTREDPKNMVLFHSTFDPLQETPLSEDQQPENQFMSVGWGKKETQFHGSEGKQAAKKKEEFQAPNIEELDKTVKISWRGDCELFAVSFVGANGRMFNVFNKEGILQFASEKVSILESPIAWRVSGNWIAIPQAYPSRYVITLFEKNGLRHQEVPLPFEKQEESVVKLSWNLDSEILLVETMKQKEGNKISCLYLFVIGNYHWYLKQFLEFSKKIQYCWSSNYMEPKKLYLLDSDGNYFTYKWDYTINKSNGMSDTDESLIAVIDDSQILVTNFKSQIVPPPMSSYQLKLENRINFVDFLVTPSETLDSNCFFVITGNSEIRFYKSEFKDVTNGRMISEIQEFNKISVADLAGDHFQSLHYSHPLWLNENYFFLANANELLILKLENQSFQLQDQFEFEKVIGGLVCCNKDSVVVQFVDGSINEILITGSSFLNEVGVAKLPEFCEKISAISRKGQLEVYGMKNIKKKLYMNDTEIGNEVTSFTITSKSDFLIYTTISELKFLDVSQKNFNYKNPIYKRRVERGSKIVGLVKDKSQTILQMPRGNLEVINPRILSLKIIKRFLEAREYRSVFDLLRKERINLNLLLDLNPDRFVEDLPIFVEQIDNIQWLNLFLTDLKNEDVTKTMYSFCISSESPIINEKIEFVCGKAIELFKQMDSVKYLLPIITCYVKLEQIEKALEMIWDLKKLGTKDKEADDAFKYLLYLIDINPLYNVALGMYDYNLVSYVAQKSQKDPKEYLPFLNELKKLDQNYARYKIDCHLKKYEKAIANISNMTVDSEKLEECLELIKKHKLYDIGMKVFAEKNQEFYKKVCNLYGDHLRIQGKLLDASLMYERGEDYCQAINSSRNILDWQKIIRLSKKNGASFEEIKGTLEKLRIVSALQDNGRYQEAVEVVRLFHSEDKKLLVDVLVKGRMFSKAILEASVHLDEEYIESYIKPEIQGHLEVLLKNLEDDRNTFQQQKERILKIREEKHRKQQNIEDGIEDDDGFSDTTSLMDSSKYSDSSRASGKTFKSSKNRRKHERKLLNLKEGNKYEDIAIIDALYKLVQKIFDSQYQNSVKEIVKVALEMNLDEQGAAVQRAFRKLLLYIKESLDEIWIPELVTSAEFPTGPCIDYQMYTNELRYALIKPHQRFKPHDLNVIDFEIEFFKENKSKK